MTAKDANETIDMKALRIAFNLNSPWQKSGCIRRAMRQTFTTGV